MNYLKISRADVANGPGVRCVLWVSGCDLRCPGCHNPDSHCFEAGQLFDEAAYQETVEILSRPFIDGLTLSGGHPFAPGNAECCYKICQRLREDLPNKTIWGYCGYTLTIDDICGEASNKVRRLAQICDVVVDGPFFKDERDITLKFRGSRNQRLIDIKKSRAAHEIILWEENK